MLSIDLHEWRRFRWRVLQWLLAVTVSLVLLGGAALEAGRRLAPTGPGLDGRLVTAESPHGKPT